MRLRTALHSADSFSGGKAGACHGTIARTGATELIRTSDVANAAAFLGVPERTLADWYYDFLQRRPNPTGKPLKVVRRMGIDELKVKKKDQQYVAVIVDHDNHRVLDVLENREKATISRYLQQCRQGGLLAHVEEVTIDMWSPYEVQFGKHLETASPSPLTVSTS